MEEDPMMKPQLLTFETRGRPILFLLAIVRSYKRSYETNLAHKFVFDFL